MAFPILESQVFVIISNGTLKLQNLHKSQMFPCLKMLVPLNYKPLDPR